MQSLTSIKLHECFADTQLDNHWQGCSRSLNYRGHEVGALNEDIFGCIYTFKNECKYTLHISGEGMGKKHNDTIFACKSSCTLVRATLAFVIDGDRVHWSLILGTLLNQETFRSKPMQAQQSSCYSWITSQVPTSVYKHFADLWHTYHMAVHETHVGM